VTLTRHGLSTFAIVVFGARKNDLLGDAIDCRFCARDGVYLVDLFECGTIGDDGKVIGSGDSSRLRSAYTIVRTGFAHQIDRSLSKGVRVVIATISPSHVVYARLAVQIMILAVAVRCTVTPAAKSRRVSSH
jgi:hypothetical protein